MIILPKKSDRFAWFFILSWLPLAWGLRFCDLFDTSHAIELSMLSAISLIFTFARAFSVYEVTNEGITRKVLFVSRHFAWDEFKFIGIQTPQGGLFKNSGPHLDVIKCSTIALPKLMTKKQFDEKVFWQPSKTIIIPWPDKNGDEVYREFLSYCGGERDIRE